MKINCLKKYLFGNFISLFGYLVFIFFVHYFLVFRPKDLIYQQELVKKYGDGFISGFYEIYFLMIYAFLIILFLILLLVEFLIRKKIKSACLKNISVPENFSNMYNVLFLGGIFFVTLPLWFFLYILWIFFISSFRY